MVILAVATYGQWYQKFNKRAFPQQKEMTKEDYVIVLGEFGITNASDEWMQLDWLDEQPFTTLFLEANQSYAEYLERFFVKEWHGGKARYIRPSIICLQNGQSYEINGIKFEVFDGGIRRDDFDEYLD